jgi:hypothetical protein
MMKLNKTPRGRRGSALVTVVVFTLIAGAAVATISTLSVASYRKSARAVSSSAAFLHAENALLEGVARIAEAEDPPVGQELNYVWPFIGTSTLEQGNLFAAYAPTDRLDAATLAVSAHPNGQENLFVVLASATYDGQTRTIRAEVVKDPPARVFDYEYFLNNWGWWWGSTITGNGDQRTNWDFDFKYNPRVNGHVYANGNVVSDGNVIDTSDPNPPLQGTAHDDPEGYIHGRADRLQMPNLKDFGEYAAKALAHFDPVAGTNRLVAPGVTINGVHSTAAAGRGVYLDGTTTPITINGTVVVHGDVVIKGQIQGQGTLYVGGNLYMAGDVTYVDGPNFSTPPASMSPEDRDNWVANSADSSLVAFAVRESIFQGRVNDSGWKSRVYDNSSYGLKNVGAEANLGRDGILHTADDGVNYLDTNGDGAPDSSWYDADADGVVDGVMDYATQIQMTNARANLIDGYPKVGSTPRSFNDLSTSDFNRVDGILYCNHAYGAWSNKSNFVFNGSLICRDEAWIFRNTNTMVYDERVHSRYNNDPNALVDLGLPPASRVEISNRFEVEPNYVEPTS